jgi:trafficking protein particle complex subunit 8
MISCLALNIHSVRSFIFRTFASRMNNEISAGRLLYTTGDIADAVRYFLGVLRVSSLSQSSPSMNSTTYGHTNGVVISESSDRVFLEDFRVSFSVCFLYVVSENNIHCYLSKPQHFKSTAGDIKALSDMKVPFSFCVPNQTRLRLPRDPSDGHSADWQMREEEWRNFWKLQGPERLQLGGKAAVNGEIPLILPRPPGLISGNS